MSDEAGFLKAISDNPADEAARLVYADWLAERDDPRAAFARLSGEFLRCVRGLGDLRRTFPSDWTAVIDPLSDRFQIVRLVNPGEGIEGGTITALRVVPGEAVVRGQAVVEVSTDKALMEIAAEESGVIISCFVQPGDYVRVGQPLLVSLSLPVCMPPAPNPPPLPPPRPTVQPQVPREPFAAFIRNIERERDSLRTATPEWINGRITYTTTAAGMIFGGRVVFDAWMTAAENRGWERLSSLSLETRMKNRGLTDEQMVQERLDIHIEMLRVLLETHGQPVQFRELPESPQVGE